MSRPGGLALALLVLALTLTACTGTSSPQAPRLLVVTHGGASGDAVSLVADYGPGEAERLEFLAGTSIELNGEAIALDVLDRAGERDGVAILVERGSGDYAAVMLSTAGIDAQAPSAFRITDEFDLTALLAAGGHDVSELCLRGIQVSREGDRLALLDVPEECPAATQAPGLFVVDVNTSVTTTFADTEQLLPTSPWLDQGLFGSGETLHYLVGVPGGAGVSSIDMEDLSGSDGPPRALPGLGSTVPLDLGPVAGSLAAITADRLSHVPLASGAAAAGSFALSNAARLVEDPYGNDLVSVQVIEGSNLAVYPGLGAAGKETVSLGAGIADVVIDGDRLWLYALRSGGITIVDMLDAASPAGRRENLPELTSPRLITWVPGVLPPPDPR